MKKLLLLSLFISSLVAAQESACSQVFHFSRDTALASQPYTHLRLNNSACKFQFAVVTDRTGGHRPGVFMDGVRKLNLLQPEFVLSVGDLIEGYTLDTAELRRQWEEFESFVQALEMPFFFVPGNHDITNAVMERIWQERFGATYYHFLYKDVLFLCLNSEDQRRGAGRGTLSDEQFAYAQKVLADNPQVRWTLVFMHQPLWHQKDTKRWRDFEALLADRPHTVFAGHEHRYVKEKRNNGKYFTLATTGGGSSLRGPTLGEFDHVVWITMTDRGPVLANLLLEGIWDEDVVTEQTKELIDRLGERTPIEIEPIFKVGEGLSSDSLLIRLINHENLPMHLQLQAGSSPQLHLSLPDSALRVPPNSQRQWSFPIRALQNVPAFEPLLIKADLSLGVPGEPAQVEYPFRFRVKPLERYTLPRRKKAVRVDANLQDWPELPHRFVRDSGRVAVDWAVAYDDDFLYFAARVQDDTVISKGEGAVWTQDNIAFGFNAEKPSRSSMSVGRHWYRQEFMQLISPAHGQVPSVLYREMPEGSSIRCEKTSFGYTAELAVPLSYVVEKQGENWQALRINVGLDDLDAQGKMHRYSWQPQWRNANNVVGSGLFWR